MNDGMGLTLGGEDWLERSSVLGDPRQRSVLSLLSENSHPMTERDLAVQIAAREGETTPAEVTEDDRYPIRIDLHHRCLPKLEAVGWIERRPDGVVPAEPHFSANVAESLRSIEASDVQWEQVAAVLARPHRIDVLAVLDGSDWPESPDELARELADHERPRWTVAADETTLSTSLHHIDLPALDEVGLLGYDPDERTIAPEPDLTTAVDWIDAAETWESGVPSA